MGLNLSPFKNIWNDVATPVENAGKAVADTVDLGWNNLTGNTIGANNARIALGNAVNAPIAPISSPSQPTIVDGAPAITPNNPVPSPITGMNIYAPPPVMPPTIAPAPINQINNNQNNQNNQNKNNPWTLNRIGNDLTHNIVTNAVGSGIVKPFLGTADYVAGEAGSAIANAITGENVTPDQAIQANPMTRAVNNFVQGHPDTVPYNNPDPTSAKQIIPNAIMTGVNLASSGLASGIEKGVTGVVGALAPSAASDAVTLARLGLYQVKTPLLDNAIRYGTDAVTGGVMNGIFGGANAAQQGATAPQVIKAGVQSVPLGVGIGLGIPAAIDSSKLVGRGVVHVINNLEPLINDQRGSIQLGDTSVPSPSDNTPPPPSVPTTNEADVNKVMQSNPMLPENTNTPIIPTDSNTVAATPPDVAAYIPPGDLVNKELPPETTPMDWTKVDGANQELKDIVNDTAQYNRQYDLTLNRPTEGNVYSTIMNEYHGISRGRRPALDVTNDYRENIPSHLFRKNGSRFENIASQMGYPDAEALVKDIEKEQFKRDNAQRVEPIRVYRQKALDSIKNIAQDETTPQGQQYADLLRRANAENELRNYKAADKASGYNKAKFKIPSNVSKVTKMTANQLDRYNSPEYAARNDAFNTFSDLQQQYKAYQSLFKNLSKSLKKIKTPEELANYQQQYEETTNNMRELQQAMRAAGEDYGRAKQTLNDVYPDTQVRPPKGVSKVRVSSYKAKITPRVTENKALTAFLASPEYANKNQIGAELEDIRNTNQVINKQRLQAQKAFRSLIKSPENVTPEQLDSVKTNLRELNSKYRTLSGMSHQKGLDFIEAKRQLDEKYPPDAINPPKSDKTNTVTVTGSKDNKVTVSDKNNNIVSVKNGIEKPIDSNNALPEDYIPPEQPINPETGLPANINPETGKSWNEDMFSPENIAKMEAENAKQDAEYGQLRNVDGDRALLQGIKEGKSVSELEQIYSDATGQSEEEAKKAVNSTEDFMDKIGNPGDINNNPYEGNVANYVNEVPKKGFLQSTKSYFKSLVNKAVLKANAPSDLLEIKKMLATNSWDKLDAHDQALADNLRGNSIEDVAKKAHNIANFTDYANRAKAIQDYGLAAQHEADLLDTTPYRKNYGASLHVIREDGTTGALEPEDYLGKQTGHEQGRFYDDYAEREKATGEKRATANFHEDLIKDVQRSQHRIVNRSLVRSLQEAFGSDAANVEKLQGTVALKDYPGVYVRSDVADYINSRARFAYDNSGFGHGKIAKGYDTGSQGMKDSKLSMGGFHNFNEFLNQLVLNPKGVIKMGRATLSTKSFMNKLDQWDANGTLEKALHSGLTLNAGPEVSDSWIRKIPGIKQAHDALFKRQIPFSKLQTFDKYAKDININDPNGYAQLRGLSRGINNIYGGINRLVDGMNYSKLKTVSRLVLAADYNEGQIRTFINALSKGGIEGRLARQVVIGRMIVLALPGVAQAAINGVLPQDPKKMAQFIGGQLVDPNMTTGWKTPGGIPDRISLIPGIVNKTYRAVAPAFNPNNPNKYSGLENELTGNANPLLSTINSEVTNKDFYGNKMRTGNFMQDTMNLVNSAAPIPFQPAARTLAGSPLGKNSVVKVLSGGQSGISPAQATIDISGVGRVTADPNSPEMQILNNRDMAFHSLPNNLQGVMNSIEPTWNSFANSKAQVKSTYESPYYEAGKYQSLLQYPQIYNVMKKQNDFAAAHGEPSNPLFNLNTKDFKTVATYEWLKNVDPGKSNDAALTMFAQNPKLFQKYESDMQTYGTKMNALFQKTHGLKGSNTPQINIGGIPFPKSTPLQQQLMNQYQKYSQDPNINPQQLYQWMNNNPELSKYFDSINLYDNAKRASLGEPLLKSYPTAAPSLQQWISQYMDGSKAQRTALRTANPTAFTGMQNYLTQVDAYELANNAGMAKYQGQTLNQKALKASYGLGKYDIAKGTNSSGGTEYVLNPEMAYSGGSSGGLTFAPSGYSGGSSGGGYSSGGTLLGTTPGGGKVYRSKKTGKLYETGPSWARTNSFYSHVGGSNSLGENYFGTVGGATDHAHGFYENNAIDAYRVKGRYGGKDKDLYRKATKIKISDPKAHKVSIKQGRLVTVK